MAKRQDDNDDDERSPRAADLKARTSQMIGQAAQSQFDRYDAVVFGSGVYDGSWTVEATELMRRHAAVLARRPVWLFSVGSFGDRHPMVGGLIKKEHSSKIGARLVHHLTLGNENFRRG
jgi:menaquinone-dependent protoporphyrinogen IX oxidase